MTELGSEVAALRIIASNLVGRLAAKEPDGGRGLLDEMADQCKIAAERNASAGANRANLVGETRTYIDEFFKGITIT